MSHTLFARLSAYIAKGKALARESDTNKPFGGVNVILLSDFHQFPPVAGSRNAPLFWPCNSSKDSAEELLGRKLCEEFSIERASKSHRPRLVGLAATHPSCPPIDFTTPPWNEAVLVTPRHAVPYDTFQGRPLTLSERFAVATKNQRKHREKHDERAALPNKLELAKGTKVMATFNVETDLDMANGAGKITEIVR
ncbi:hypothetical protein AZE42_11934 [Rhizopogon vesiculosus]|uniref:DNA helicase n=1 Tax=Rhizopogon vesiculosus TaxID=180088 RepID=A0A1J8PZN0_9AGAM|nr:hypothetical protein AZE42_11934 [Rhizopogon vesiculosus]